MQSHQIVDDLEMSMQINQFLDQTRAGVANDPQPSTSRANQEENARQAAQGLMLQAERYRMNTDVPKGQQHNLDSADNLSNPLKAVTVQTPAACMHNEMGDMNPGLVNLNVTQLIGQFATGGMNNVNNVETALRGRQMNIHRLGRGSLDCPDLF